MPRRAFWLGLLAIAVLLSGSLSAALGVSPSSVLLTPTLPPEDSAYMPLVAKAAAPPATATPSATATLAATATATVMATASATQPGATATISATTEPTASATAATSTATATATPSGSPTVTTTATATATATSTATATATSTATATATAEPSCLDYHYPITFHSLYLENNQPNWYKPVPLTNPYADNAQIPSLNTTNPNSPRFRVYRQSSGQAVFWAFTRWNGVSGSGSASELAAALEGRGNLTAGFSEMTPPPSDPAAQNKINGILEPGDWIPSNSGSVGGNSGIQAALDYHIATKTFMVLPVYDLINGDGVSSGSGYRVQRFATVRLLGYNLSANSWFEFALVQDNTGCVSVPPTPTVTATQTATATATATQPATANQLTLNLTERLQWVEPQAGVSSYDVVIVLDLSFSMRFCWDSNKECAIGSRRIDYAAAAIRGFIDEMLVQRYNLGIENRLALVTYGQRATKVIDFNNDRTAALAAFRNFFGDLSSPKSIPNSMIIGNTNITSGLVAANEYLNNARTVDWNGQPVNVATLLFNDGIANVFNDGPAMYNTNRYNIAPYYCGENLTDMDNPVVQATCPKQSDYPGQSISTPPLKAMVTAADAGRAARLTQFYAVVLGAQNGLDPQSMFLNEVAPDHAYMAYSPGQLEGLVTAIEEDLAQMCTEYAGGSTPAAGASVTITNQAGDPVGVFTADAQGRLVVPGLPAGAYTLSAAHLGVAAPAQPTQPRNYTRMVVDNGNPVPVGSLAFTMPAAAHALPDIRLLIDNPANAQCP